MPDAFAGEGGAKGMGEIAEAGAAPSDETWEAEEASGSEAWREEQVVKFIRDMLLCCFCIGYAPPLHSCASVCILARAEITVASELLYAAPALPASARLGENICLQSHSHCTYLPSCSPAHTPRSPTVLCRW